jgi:4-alpha-glucanotransferase
MGETARTNVPGTPEGNWEWRLGSMAPLDGRLAGDLADLTAAAGRDGFEHPNTLAY